MIADFMKDDLTIIKHLDAKIDNLISNMKEACDSNNYNYTMSDLHKKVNSEETLIEYIRDTEKIFNLSKADIESFDDYTLNKYVRKLDSLWG